MKSPAFITVIDVMRALGVEPEPRVSWAVGAAVANRYFAEVGDLPIKALRPKTGGGGSHCFALYPVSWRPIIEDAVRSAQVEAARQGDIFGYGDAAHAKS